MLYLCCYLCIPFGISRGSISSASPPVADFQSLEISSARRLTTDPSVFLFSEFFLVYFRQKDDHTKDFPLFAAVKYTIFLLFFCQYRQFPVSLTAGLANSGAGGTFTLQQSNPDIGSEGHWKPLQSS